MSDKVKSWLKMLVIAAFGGGIAGSVAALSDPAKYTFPRDLGSGKMWPFFLSGAGTAVGAMLLKSPLGIRIMDAVKQSKQDLQDSKAVLDQTKRDLKGPVR